MFTHIQHQALKDFGFSIEEIDGISRGLDDIAHGRVVPAEEVFEALHRKFEFQYA